MSKQFHKLPDNFTLVQYFFGLKGLSYGLSLVFFFIFSATNLSAQNPLDRKLDFQMNNLTLEDGLWKLSEETDIQFAFSNNDFSDQKYSFAFRQETLRFILRQILSDSPTTFSWSGNQILIFKKPPVKFTLSGYIEDKSSGERLIGANIYDKVSKKGCVSNEYGFYSLTLTKEEPALQISYLGYQVSEIVIKKSENQKINIELNPSLTLQEIVIVGSDSLEAVNQSSEYYFPLNDAVEKLPALGGEVDILRIIQQLPGAQSGTDGLGGLHVRGGNADQNLILLDGVPIYNPYHMLGLFSIFDHKSIRKVKYLRGQFPARFGGRVSSVVDVRTKEGNNKEFHGEASVGLIATKINFEGPLVKDKGAFFVSARRSHLDPFLKNYSKKDRAKDNETGFYNYYFGEILTKFNYTFSQKDRLYISFYKGFDNFHNEKGSQDTFFDEEYIYNENQNLDWGNTLGVLRWNHQLGNQLFSNLTFNFSQFNFNSDDGFDESFKFDDIIDRFVVQRAYRSLIKTASLKLDLDYLPNTNHYIRTGFTVSRNLFTPGVANLQDSSTFVFNDILPDSLINPSSIEVLDFNIYLEDEWQINPNIKLNAGVFTSFFVVKNKNYLLIDPRFSITWDPIKNLSFQFSANSMSQYLHLLTRTGSGFPNDLWVPSTDKVAPQRSRMIDLGLKWKLHEQWSFSANAYYKKMTNLIHYAEGVSFAIGADAISSNNWEDKVTSGKGLSRGLEFLLKKEKGRATGWISYTYSKTNRQFEQLNNGEVFPFRYDLRHVLNIVGSYDITPNWSVTSTWNFSSGGHINIALNEWQYTREDGTPDITYLNYGKQNSYQLPNYHRLDLSTKYKRNTSWGAWSLDLGIYNTYNQRNIFFIKPVYDPLTQSGKYRSVSLIPLLPYFSFNLKL